MAEVRSARSVKYIKNKMASLHLQSRVRRTGHSLRINTINTQSTPFSWMPVSNIWLYMIFTIKQSPFCVISVHIWSKKFFQEKTLCTNARACFPPAPRSRAWHHVTPALANRDGARSTDAPLGIAHATAVFNRGRGRARPRGVFVWRRREAQIQ